MVKKFAFTLVSFFPNLLQGWNIFAYTDWNTAAGEVCVTALLCSAACTGECCTVLALVQVLLFVGLCHHHCRDSTRFCFSIRVAFNASRKERENVVVAPSCILCVCVCEQIMPCRVFLSLSPSLFFSPSPPPLSEMFLSFFCCTHL